MNNLPQFNSVFTSTIFTDSPLGLYIALNLQARIAIWHHEDFIISQILTGRDLVFFVLSGKYKFSPSWYNFFMTTKMSFRGNRVHLNEDVTVKTEVTFLGDRKLQLLDTMYSASGVELAQMSLLYGIVNSRERKMVPLPKEAETKAMWIAEPKPPNRVQVKEASGHVLQHRKVVQPENIDHNGHTNYGVYVEEAMNAFQVHDQHLPCLSELMITVRKETSEKDVLSCQVWRDRDTSQYCCKTMCNNKMVMYAEALFRHPPPKL